MKRLTLLIILGGPVIALIIGWLVTLSAQISNAKIACRAYNGVNKTQNHLHKKKLWDGYEISLGPASDTEGPDDGCTARWQPLLLGLQCHLSLSEAAQAVRHLCGGQSQVREGQSGEDDHLAADRRPLRVHVGGRNAVWNENLTPAHISRLTSTGNTGVENEELISNLLFRALQHVFCRQFDDALNDLDVWPESTRAKVKVAFADALKANYPEFAARLRSSMTQK